MGNDLLLLLCQSAGIDEFEELKWLLLFFVFREVSRYVGELYLSGSSVPSAQLARVTSRDQDLNGKIVECYVDPAIQGWKVLRVRTDKTEPNHLSVGRRESPFLQPV